MSIKKNNNYHANEVAFSIIKTFLLRKAQMIIMRLKVFLSE